MAITARDQRKVAALDCDVVIVGAGAAGVAAATTAARAGLNVVLVERYGFCGGGAVAGLSGTICGLYEATESDSRRPTQIVFGFADEFARVLEVRGGLAEPVRYGKTRTRVHDPLVWREAADFLLKEAGVTALYHAVATQALLEGTEAFGGARLWTKEGPLDVRAKLTVDASGDADLIAMAGLPDVIGDHGRVQNPTMIFRMLGVDTDAFVRAYGDDTIMPPEIGEQIIAANASGRYKLPRTKIWLFRTTRPGELLCNCTRITGGDGRELNTLFWRDFAEAEIEGRLQMREYARFFRDNLIGCERAFVNDTGAQVGVRQTRQIVGVEKLTNSDIVGGRKTAEGIARSAWPIELHSGARPKVEWLLDDFYEVPYRCFVPAAGENILAAGRCLSAEHEAVASARVTAQCFAYGHAVGHAAAIAVTNRISPRTISGADLRQVLNRDGARLQ
ncbi:FAD-dependent oxidoreductase [Bradyrhizobium diversitatis]|uniref:FAD-dependent oxidoreductase n=1 Tax=Bradyrhizobium diversitatis TaxID=2755406 RepID=A0ABS0PG78_9BRAD|nr:FAD-dependent oxidoreductase [Bradyrhizobium diversitatis]MBH5392055.1 FAD-dependent oxidoreductase [Bradyrhizobium diversitatis]